MPQKRLLHTMAQRWETLPVQRQAAIAYPTLVAAVFLLHMTFFPWLSWTRKAGYALFESIPLMLLVLLATASERARKARLQAQQDAFELAQMSHQPADGSDHQAPPPSR